MTFAELEQKARQNVAEPDAGFLTKEEFIGWANDCMLLELAIKLPRRALRKLQTKAKSTISSSDYTYTLPSDFQKFIQFRVVDDTETGENVISFYPNDFEEADNIQLATGISNFYQGRMWGEEITFSDLPVGKILILYYIKRPTRIVEDADIPEFPEEIQMLIPYYMAFRAANKLGDTQRFTINRSLYEEGLMTIIKKYEGQKIEQVKMNTTDRKWR